MRPRHDRTPPSVTPPVLEGPGSLCHRPQAKLPFTLAKLRRGARVGALLDAAHDERFARALIDAVSNGRSIATAKGQLAFEASGTWDPVPADASVRSVGAEQSNNALIVDERILVKLYRRLREGVQPEIEMARFLSRVAGFKNTPALMGLIEHRPEERPPTVLGALFEFVRNQGDCWQVIVEALDRHLDDALMAPPPEEGAQQEAPAYLHPLDLPSTLGQRTAEMHKALAIDTDDPAFAREPVVDGDMKAWVTRSPQASSAAPRATSPSTATVAVHQESRSSPAAASVTSSPVAPAARNVGASRADQVRRKVSCCIAAPALSQGASGTGARPAGAGEDGRPIARRRRRS
jgi:maltose alpha-D-glucosyltransferase/alpha-amylase